MKRLWPANELGERWSLQDTPLVWSHVSPYGIFDLDCKT